MQNDGPITTNEKIQAIPFPGDLLDYFVGQALAGSLASSEDGCQNYPFAADYGDASVSPESVVALNCYGLAEAMLAEREKRKNDHK